MGFLNGFGLGDDSLLFFLLIVLVLFGTDIFGRDCCDGCDGNDNSILFFIILFLLLFNGNGSMGVDRRDLGCAC